ncbi:MAG: hypothetical protein A3J38_06290 [Gammaproteobacteria bacterium RIFCSPHIGHO2_12_FULL_45_9]|nr:MAG: hypothetical protein A3J38_06290 [Gammaproteobacteria bacterium RIFCSPHIGHO2_12_FULL_45_9]
MNLDWKAILDQLPVAVFVKDAEGRYIYMNEFCAKHAGVSMKDIMGKTDKDIFSKETAEKIHIEDLSAIKHGHCLISGEEWTKRYSKDHLSFENEAVLKTVWEDPKTHRAGVFGIAVPHAKQ